MSNRVRLTMLNAMAGNDFEEALDNHAAWGLTDLDLKDNIYDTRLMDLSDEAAARASRAAADRGLNVYGLSTDLFNDDIEKGEAHFEAHQAARIDRAIALARIFRPRFIRFLSAQSSKRRSDHELAAYLQDQHPWLIQMYAHAADQVTEAGFEVCIENEVGGTLFRSPEDVLSFFEILDREEGVCFTYDVQNMWQVGGIFPTLATYDALKPVIGFLHLKGGMAEKAGGQLKWRSSLEDASWPVADVLRQVAADGISPVVCLNPSHGELKAGYDMNNIVKRDIDFLRREVPGVV